jgi:hypothetical protein
MLPFLGCSLVAIIPAAQLQALAVAGYTLGALGGILVFYRACRHGVRFDDGGVTVRNFYRTQKLNWLDVSRFTDGKIGVLVEGSTSYFWAVQIVLHDGRSITAEGTMREKQSNIPRVMTTIEQVADRWQTPSTLTGIANERLEG